jgi:hypothetical protein
MLTPGEASCPLRKPALTCHRRAHDIALFEPVERQPDVVFRDRPQRGIAERSSGLM